MEKFYVPIRDYQHLKIHRETWCCVTMKFLTANDATWPMTDCFYQARVQTGNLRVRVTVKETAAKILQQFKDSPQTDDEEAEKRKIVRAAARLIKADIKNIDTCRDFYSDPSELRWLEKNMVYVPQSLRILLQETFSGNSCDLKLHQLDNVSCNLPDQGPLLHPFSMDWRFKCTSTLVPAFLWTVYTATASVCLTQKFWGFRSVLPISGAPTYPLQAGLDSSLQTMLITTCVRLMGEEHTMVWV